MRKLNNRNWRKKTSVALMSGLMALGSMPLNVSADENQNNTILKEASLAPQGFQYFETITLYENGILINSSIYLPEENQISARNLPSVWVRIEITVRVGSPHLNSIIYNRTIGGVPHSGSLNWVASHQWLLNRTDAFSGHIFPTNGVFNSDLD
ncbi:MAG: hypothetical protein FWF50_03880 [Defluviitaleaceae bacterium]|nr:hypothetical protein [Defluviitaleaceae bacterium]